MHEGRLMFNGSHYVEISLMTLIVCVCVCMFAYRHHHKSTTKDLITM